MELSSNDRTIRRVLAETFFQIPRYQRPYSWTRDNIDDLWEDAIEGPANEYFIGSVVVHPVSRDTVALVDGQQRLTTLLMILCAVRDVAEELHLERLANGTHNLVERKDEDDDLRAVLKSETAEPFLGDYVLNRGAAKLGTAEGREQEAIQDAFEQIKAKVKEEIKPILGKPASGRRRDAALEKALKRIRETVLGLKVIFVEAGTQDEATTVFVTLNSRGKDLEPSDLVKAQLLNHLPKSGGVDSPLERWQRIIELFDASEARPGMTDFLLSFWRSRYGPVTQKTLDKEVRKRIKKADADRLMAELTEDAKLFRALVEPSYRRWGQHSDLPRSLEFLVDFGVRQPRPLLLSLLRAYSNKQIKVAQFRRALAAIENYHFTYNILAGRSSTGGMSAFYASRALRLTDTSSSQERAGEIDELVRELKHRRPTDEEFDLAFTALSFTDDVTANKKKVQYALRRFHEFDAPKAPIDFSMMTIEHLTPQSSGDGHIGQMGNLVYVSETLNSKLGNKSFQAKLKVLSQAKEWVPADILEARRWDKKAIEKRTERMAIEGRTKVWK